MSPLTYRSAIRGKVEESRFALRLELVRYAQDKGIREAARTFGCSRNTVRCWLRRHEAQGAGGLVDQSRAPKRIPHKASVELEQHVEACRKRAPCMGPRRLKHEFDLPLGKNAIGRILREKELVRRRRRKRERQNDLREVKARYQALTHLQMDVKYLTDLPEYWPQMEALGLPRFQYTIRDTKSGGTFLGFGDELSVTFSSLLIRRCLTHLSRWGIDPAQVIVQTDRGSEFGGGQKRRIDRGFVHIVRSLGARHVFTPPRWPNANADVEAFHRIIEEEFFDLEHYSGLEGFLRKVTVYQHYFNLGRPNSYKGGRTPWDIILLDHPNISPEVLLLPPVLLEREFDREGVGQDVPGLDDSTNRST